MKYLAATNGEIIFKDDAVWDIIESDRPLSDDMYNKFFELQSQGKQFELKDINGGTFTEIFEEIPPYIQTELELAQAELNELDEYLPRCVEDLINAIGLDTKKLPQVMQDRLSRKRELRTKFSSV